MRIPLALPAALVGVLLLTACGSKRAGARADGSPCAPSPAGAPATTGAPVPPGGLLAPSPAATPPAAVPSVAPSGPEGDVRIIAPAGQPGDCPPPPSPAPLTSARFQVTNHGTEPLTYTITFTFVSDSGGAMSTVRRTVASVGPGQRVRGTVEAGELPPSAPTVARVSVTQVRSVPAAEAPATTGPCPPSGVRVTADDGDAAMGLRVVGLHLENCSDRPYTLDGYPTLQLLDEDRRPVTGVQVLHGSDGIATVTGFDDRPLPLTLKPGQRASSGLTWRNTVTVGTVVNVPYVRVNAKPGAAWVTVTPELDLGTTGKLGVGPWRKDDAQR